MDIDIPTQIRNLFEGIRHQERMTHSSVVIAIAAILDNQLEHALKHAMRSLSNNMYERLFDPFRPLGDFAGKIVMAYALGIISTDDFDELEKVRNIRNRFAHSSGVLHLGSPEIEPIFLTLKRPSTAVPTMSPPEVFLACVRVIEEHLKAYLATPPGGPELQH